MQKMICDRCGNDLDGTGPNAGRISIDTWGRLIDELPIVKDLCGNCMEGIYEAIGLNGR